MPVTFQVIGNLKDYVGADDRAGVKVRAVGLPGIKISDTSVHSNRGREDDVLTDEDGDFTLELVSLPGLWYRISTPYSGALPTINLAGYVPDVDDPTTGTVFPPGTVIDVKDVANENPTPGYEAVVFGGNATWAALPDKPDLADVATSGEYGDLTGKPTLGTAAATAATAYATAAQGAKADAAGKKPALPMGQAQDANARPYVLAYRPTSLASVNTNTTGTAISVDSTNLKMTVVVPESGKFRFTLMAQGAAPAGGSQLRWSLRVNGTTIADTVTGVVTASATDPVLATRCVAGGILAKDGAGNPLVPGKEISVEWGHANGTAGVTCQTIYGSQSGAAIMELTPVVNRITEQAYTPTVTGPGITTPLWLCHDRVTLLGTPSATWRLGWSTDDGATWTNTDATFPANIQHARELDNGEVVVFVANNGGGGAAASAWVSTGWAANHQTATFAKTLDQLQTTTTSGSWRSWSMDTFGPIVLAAEYGVQTNLTAMARYVYLSEDYGQTWRTIFDLGHPSVYPGDGSHTHGVAYDPWWDAIWLTTGDGASNYRNFVTFDRGATWRRLELGHQFTAVYPLPGCVLFVTDSGSPNGIYRVPRTHPAGPLTGEWALRYDENASITVLGNQCFRSRAIAGAPLLLSCDTGTASGPGHLFVTYDGYTFREAWKDSTSYINQGLRTMVGPTRTGKYVGRLDRAGTNLDAAAEMLTLTPPA